MAATHSTASALRALAVSFAGGPAPARADDAGGMVTASPLRLRFGALNASVDLGAVIALGEDDPVAPFLMPAVSGWF